MHSYRYAWAERAVPAATLSDSPRKPSGTTPRPSIVPMPGKRWSSCGPWRSTRRRRGKALCSCCRCQRSKVIGSGRSRHLVRGFVRLCHKPKDTWVGLLRDPSSLLFIESEWQTSDNSKHRRCSTAVSCLATWKRFPCFAFSAFQRMTYTGISMRYWMRLIARTARPRGMS